MAAAWLTVDRACAQALRLTDGRIIEGRWSETSGVAELPDAPNVANGEIATRPIRIIYDELRRIYIPKVMVAEITETARRPPVKISIWQNTVNSGATLSQVGPSLNVTPFDKYGRRIYELQTPQGRQSFVQGITELTPRYAKIDALRDSQPRDLVWSMRMATSSIPPQTLTEILRQNVPQDDPAARLQVVQFYLQAERYDKAHQELQRVIDDFPGRNDLQPELRRLKQMTASWLLGELKQRESVGQYELAARYLQIFPTDDVAGETLTEVRQLLVRHEERANRILQIKEALGQVVDLISDPDERGITAPVVDEIVRELGPATEDRLAPFVQLLGDASLSTEEKAALAISGWLLGAEDAQRNLAVAISLVKVRDGVRSYLRETLAPERAGILTNFRSLEGADVANVAKLIAQMKPVWHDDELVQTEHGMLELVAPGQTDHGDFRYLVQLPPEYDPYRRYPTIIALNDGYNSPRQELEFWAGSPQRDSEGKVTAPRRGQSIRHGYITISIDWHKPHQYQYEYAAREHVAVLTCLRDAMRRFSLDADRVFLSGHGIGGDAAWDIGQSHPDLWAGVLPIGAHAGDSYIRHYWENAKHLPMYFIAGELDGTKMTDNSPVWDRYLKKRFNATVIEYLGRGHEPFRDEIVDALDWMGRQRRRRPPQEFDCDTLRPWDNYFWWIECEGFPHEMMVHPLEWDATRGRARPIRISGSRTPNNRLRVKVPKNEKTTIWLNPDIVDFDNPTEPIRVLVGARKLRDPEGGIRPDLEVLLEDVRTRTDRQRPFWAKVETR